MVGSVVVDHNARMFNVELTIQGIDDKVLKRKLLKLVVFLDLVSNHTLFKNAVE